MPKKMEEEKLQSLKKVRCPQCGGEVNKVWFHDYNALESEAIFIAECWSGDLSKPSEYHIFKIRVPIPIEVDLTEEE